MRELATFLLTTSLLLGGCAGSTGRTDCPPSPANGAMPSELTPGDFAEWESMTLAYAEGLVGMDEEAAERCALSEGFSWRVVGRDGDYFPVTADYSPNRINATVVQSIVETVSAG